MQLNSDALETHLARGIKPIYIVSGDDPLLAQEAADAIRAAALKAGCEDRNVANVGAGFDWDAWFNASQNGSLFASRTLNELRLGSAKPPAAATRVLADYGQRAAKSLDVLLLTLPKLDSAAKKSAWFSALEQNGVWIQIWPLNAGQLPGWARNRMKRHGLQPSPDAVTALVERVEGNLLACAQEIDKLALLHGPGALSVDDVVEAIADSARFDVFELADCVLNGQSVKVARIVSRLREEGVEPTIVLWALAKEARQLAQLEPALKQGGGPGVWRKFAIWERRQPLYRKALQRVNVDHWRQMLRRAAFVDRVTKGASPGNPWDELLKLGLAMAGAPASADRFRRDLYI